VLAAECVVFLCIESETHVQNTPTERKEGQGRKDRCDYRHYATECMQYVTYFKTSCQMCFPQLSIRAAISHVRITIMNAPFHTHFKESVTGGVRMDVSSLVCCSVFERVAACCRVTGRQNWRLAVLVLQCVAVCCSVPEFVTWSRWQDYCVAVCCSVLQCAAVCCSVLQVARLDVGSRCLSVFCGELQRVAQ